jgi:hypothetical protein
MAKLTEADKQYQAWVAEKDAVPKQEEADETQTITVNNGDAVIVVRNFTFKETEPVIEVTFDASKKMNEAALLAVGITRCLQDEGWMEKLLKRTHKWVSELLREERGKEM